MTKHGTSPAEAQLCTLIGYLPFEPDAAHLFFQLVSRRYGAINERMSGDRQRDVVLPALRSEAERLSDRLSA